MNRKIKLLIMMVVVFIGVGLTVRIYYVNKNVKIIKEEYFVNVPFTVNNVLYTVVEYSAREDKNFEECVVLDVKINIKNNSESDQECDFTEIMLDYNDNCKNVSMDAFYQMSQQEAGLCTITPPGDEFDVVLPFLINKGQLNNGSTVDFNKAQLVFSLYPTKKYMNLHT